MNTPTSSINRTFLILLLGILAAIGPFTIDMYLPAFGQIASDFQTDEQRVAFTLTSYFAGIAIGQLFYGPIVDKYGRKRPLIIGLSIYILASIGCAHSAGIGQLILFRLLQALGGCVGMVATNAIISDVYEKQDRAKAFSSLMLVMGVAPLIAPSVGSLLLEHSNWHFIFYFLGAFAALVIILLVFWLPETSIHMHRRPLQIKKISREYLAILKNRTFLTYTLAGSLAMSILFAYISSASFLFQTLYQLNKTTFSILFAIVAAGLISGSTLNGLLNRRMHFIKIARLSASLLIGVTALGLSIVSFYNEVPYQLIVALMFLILFLIGFVNPNATAASLIPFTENAGTASALGGAIRMGTGAAVAAAIGTFQGSSAITVFVSCFILALGTAVMLRLSGNSLLQKMDYKNQVVSTS